MKRADLEHILRACRGVTGETEFVLIGSQSILGPHPDAPRELRESMEADLYPRHRPNLSSLIEGSLGELSMFHTTFGYFADGVSPSTAALPEGWEERLIPISNENTGGATGWCLDPHDLAFSKLAARREKDLKFVGAMLWHKMVRPSRLLKLISTVSDRSLRERLHEALAVCRAGAP
jgi:Nucleotidyltransferase of unknown function (DUF6036)